MRRSIAPMALIGFAAVAVASGAEAATKNRASAQGRSDPSASDRLNEESLRRVRQGLASPTPGPDSTAALNRMSEQDAARGVAVPRPPMPFR